MSYDGGGDLVNAGIAGLFTAIVLFITLHVLDLPPEANVFVLPFSLIMGLAIFSAVLLWT